MGIPDYQTVWIKMRPDIVRLDLDPNCLQKLSADDTSWQRVTLNSGALNYLYFTCLAEIR